MIIYGIKEKSSQRIVYVGQTIRTMAQRGYPRTNIKFTSYCESKGLTHNDFEHVCLKETDNQELADAYEKFYILLYNTIDNGFNLATGGIGLTKQAKPFYQITNNTKLNRFDSLACAERITGINKSNILNCLLGKRRTAGGYEWKYE